MACTYKSYLSCSKQIIFEHGECCRKLLAYLSREQSNPPLLTQIFSPEGNLVKLPDEILTIFANYYKHLYSSQITSNYEDAQHFLANFQLPQLTTKQWEYLDNDITDTEIKEAIASLKKQYDPGPRRAS